MTPDPAMERLATLLVANCFRNTMLEDYRAEWPQFTEAKMKPLMQEAVNKLYTALCAILGGDRVERDAMWGALNWQLPAGWDPPQFDQALLRAMELVKQGKGADLPAASKPDAKRKPKSRGDDAPGG